MINGCLFFRREERHRIGKFTRASERSEFFYLYHGAQTPSVDPSDALWMDTTICIIQARRRFDSNIAAQAILGNGGNVNSAYDRLLDRERVDGP